MPQPLIDPGSFHVQQEQMGSRRLSASFDIPPKWHCNLHRSEEHTSELQSPCNLVCRLLLEKKTDERHQQCALASHTQPRGLRARALRHEPRSAVDPMRVFHSPALLPHLSIFFFNDTATTEIYTLSLHDALPIFNFGQEYSGQHTAGASNYGEIFT